MQLENLQALADQQAQELNEQKVTITCGALFHGTQSCTHTVVQSKKVPINNEDKAETLSGLKLLYNA